MKRRRMFVATLVAGSLLLAGATTALALDSDGYDVQTATSNGNKISAKVDKQAASKRIACAGKNERSSGYQVDYILVSYVCQYWTGSTWADWHTAPKHDCSNCASTGWSNNDYYYPCDHFGSGTVSVRGQADGYYINNGFRNDFAGDGVETDYVNFSITNLC